MAEIASRLRVRTLRDANAGTEPDPVGPAGGLPGRGPLLPSTIGTGCPGGYEPIRVTVSFCFIWSSILNCLVLMVARLHLSYPNFI